MSEEKRKDNERRSMADRRMQQEGPSDIFDRRTGENRRSGEDRRQIPD